MCNRLFGFSSVLRASVFGLVGIACLASGCASSDSMKAESAPKAWEDLKSNETKGSIGGAFVGGTIGGVIARSSASETQKANQEANDAMRSDLPGEALDAMVTDMAAYFSEKVPQLPEVKAAKGQFVLAFGSLGDAGGNEKTQEVLDGLRGKLFKNSAMTDNFVFVKSTESDAKALSAKIAGGDTSAFRDPLQNTADKTKPVVYNPADIYLITGSMTSSKQYATHSVEITMTFEFTPLLARTVEVSQSFNRTYMWHPAREEWELQK